MGKVTGKNKKQKLSVKEFLFVSFFIALAIMMAITILPFFILGMLLCGISQLIIKDKP
jgi:hypothetical protein